MAKCQFIETNHIKPGMDILMTKWIALEGTIGIVEARELELKKRLPAYLLETAKDFSKYLSVETEIKLASNYSAITYPISQGGIFSALWNMAEASKVGLEIEVRKIAVRQETIEICECFRLNPYLLLSNGALLLAADRGHDIARRIQKEGIACTVIGKATDSKDRILWNEEECRYLDRAQKDELYKIMIEKSV